MTSTDTIPAPVTPPVRAPRTEPIDFDEVLPVLRTVVQGYGPGHVAACMYVDRDADVPTPVCIVGNAHYWLTGDLVPEDREGKGILACRYGVGATTTPWFPEYTRRALEVLDEAQDAQDRGMTWGEALLAAEEKAAEYARGAA